VPGGRRRHQYIHDFAPAREVPTFDQSGSRAEVEQIAARGFHRRRVAYHPAGEERGLIEVRCDQGGLREQPLAEDSLRVGGKQVVAGSGHHDRITDVCLPLVAGDPVGDQIDQGRGREHAGLEGRWREVVGEGCQLLPDECVGGNMDGADAPCVLGSQRHNDAGAIHTELLKGLEVGLNAGPAAGV